MGRLYSNPNDRFRKSNLGRVTYQQLEPVAHPTAAANEANQMLAEMDEAVKDHHAKRMLREMMRIKPIMEARKDKRRRPRGVSKEAFKLYRKLRLKAPVKKKARAAPKTKESNEPPPWGLFNPNGY